MISYVIGAVNDSNKLVSKASANIEAAYKDYVELCKNITCIEVFTEEEFVSLLTKHHWFNQGSEERHEPKIFVKELYIA